VAQRKEEIYKFTPGAAGVGTIKFPGHVESRNLIMITNADTGQIIYNQFDPSKGAIRSHEHIWQGDPDFPDVDFPWSIDGTCVFTFDADTSSMSSTDQLSVLIDDYRSGTKFRPYDHGLDAVEKMRVSNPESRIDTDFELGIQETKWEAIGYNKNHAAAYRYGGSPLSLSSLSSDGGDPATITGTVAAGTGPAAGEPVSIEGTSFENANGTRICLQSDVASGTFVYQADGAAGSGTIDNVVTEVRKADFYTSSNLPIVDRLQVNNGSRDVTVTFLQEHGLFPGSKITLIDTDRTTNTPSSPAAEWEGSFFVKEVTNGEILVYELPTALTAASVDITTNGQVQAIANDASFARSRPFDGGVQIGTSLPVHSLKIVRQTKDYFRYQSGKGIWWSTAVSFQPNYPISGVTVSGGIVTVTTEVEHGIGIGARIFLEGVKTADYYGAYFVSNVTSSTTFEATPVAGQTAPTVSPGVIEAGAKYTVERWAGASIRTGLFDDQNGMFFEWDGHKFWVVRRSTTTKLVGTVDFSAHTVTGTGTKFTEQLSVHDKIVIRGASYEVTAIESDTSLRTACGNRSGTAITGATATKTVEIRIPQEDFNYDTCDGQGPSGFLLRPRYTQMVGIDYSWYGSGFIDFKIRGPLGEWIKVHRMPNHNIYSEAYLRSGNLPGRYEIHNECGYSTLDGQLLAGATTIPIADARLFPDGSATYPVTIALTGWDATAGTTLTELCTYHGIVRNTLPDPGGVLQNVTRRTTMSKVIKGKGYDGTDFSSFSGITTNRTFEDGDGVALIGTNLAPTLNHWGCSVSMDGGFDRIPGFIFSYEVDNNGNELYTDQLGKTFLAFRLCPAVSNSQPQAFGEREIVNRQELKLKSIEITNQDGFEAEVSGFLNPRNLGEPSYVRSSSQSFNGVTTFQPTFTEIADTGGIVGTATAPQNTDLLFTFVVAPEKTTTVFDLSGFKNLENSIQGGNKVYPDGPEVLLVYINVLDPVGVDSTLTASTDGSPVGANYKVVLRWEEAGS
jgi:hypothetical protein